MENVLACFTEIALYHTFGKPVFSRIYEPGEKENTECACLSCFIQIRIQFRLLKADTIMHFEEKRVFIFCSSILFSVLIQGVSLYPTTIIFTQTHRLQYVTTKTQLIILTAPSNYVHMNPE